LQAKVLPQAPQAMREPRREPPAPAKSTQHKKSGFPANVASRIACGVIGACLAFWIAIAASWGFGIGIQTYLTRGMPVIAQFLTQAPDNDRNETSGYYDNIPLY
jgi:hypothetical protein